MPPMREDKSVLNFTQEIESNSTISFLDVRSLRSHNRVNTSVHVVVVSLLLMHLLYNLK